MHIGSRIKQHRNQLGLNQAEYAEKLGLKQGIISAMEKGTRNVSDRTIRIICSEFNVSERWLRTGEGEPFVTLSRKDEVTAYVEKVLKNEPESFRSRLISALCRLNESEWDVLEKIALQMLPQEPQPEILPFAARSGANVKITETSEQKEKRRAETLRDLDTIPDYSFDDE